MKINESDIGLIRQKCAELRKIRSVEIAGDLMDLDSKKVDPDVGDEIDDALYFYQFGKERPCSTWV